MTTNTQEPSTDPQQILMGMEGDLYSLRDACDALCVFSKGHEGHREEAQGLRFLAIEIQARVEAVKREFERLDNALSTKRPVRAVS